MVNIHGIGGVPEPTPDRASGARGKRGDNDVNSDSRRDGVDISQQGREAADISRLRAIAAGLPDIRAERVEQARLAIEKGAHKDEGIIVEIARRLEKLFS